MMSIREMQYFLAVAQEGNITTAAQRLNIAQPPLSRQMKQLEESLGTRLFIRGHRRIQLTEAGCLLRNRAEQLLKLMDNTEKEIKAIETGTHGTLSIGTASSSGTTILPKVARIFHTHYPNLNFELWEGESIRIIELLNGGLIEIGLVRFSFDTDTYESIQLPKEPLVAAIHQNRLDPSEMQQDCILLSQLADKPLMIHRKCLSPALILCSKQLSILLLKYQPLLSGCATASCQLPHATFLPYSLPSAKVPRLSYKRGRIVF
ncbi:MAG: transcriptional regulator, LysR family [Anaerospora sp.]|nr:transcriptional regulator, LysR family [Anaerospora sp.]